MTARRAILLLGVVVTGSAAVGGAAVGCAAPPEVFFIEPNQITAGERTTVRIRGAGFEWEYNAFLDSAEGTFEAEVGSTPLEELTWLEVTQLEGVVPDTVEPGLHTVTVRTAHGEDSLENAILLRPADAP